VPSPGEAKTDLAIFSLIAGRFGDQLSYTGPAAIFAELKQEAPGYQAIEFDKIGPQGVVWGGENLKPAFKKLVAVEGSKPVEARFQMVTGSALYHSGTLSTHAKGPLAAMPEPYVEFGAEDAAELALKEGETVAVKGNGAELRLKVKLGKRLPKGLVFVPYHFGDAGVNQIYRGESSVPVEISK
jgi:predicted molibdopterin-dependent oxidoreductase YjgC